MTSLMTGSFERIEVITRVARRRRWSVEEKRRIVAESLTPDLSVSLVAASHGLQPNQLFRWRKLVIDNNRAENALRGVALGPKNWLLAGSDNMAAKAPP